jgi:1-acyl-sn-glycerol-3-phosphate acyltransferase
VIRSIFVLLAGVILTFSLSAWVRFSGLIRAPWAHDHCSRASSFWGRAMVRLAGVRVILEGATREKMDRPLVVVANHQSWFDVFVLGGLLPGRARFVAKEELRRIPLFGAAWETCGHIRVNRGDRAEAVRSLNEAGTRIRDERLNVILFPEGTRSPDGHLLPFKEGAFVLAIQTGVPVLPVGISGSRAVMSKGSFRIRPGEIRVRVGEPIPVEGLTTADRDRLLARARREILALMDASDGGEVDASGRDSDADHALDADPAPDADGAPGVSASSLSRTPSGTASSRVPRHDSIPDTTETSE